VRRLVVASLAGHDVREAADGEEALRKVDARRPHAIVLDLGLPKLDGFDVLERLQSDDETRTIPVIVLTARHLSPDERQRVRSRTTALLLKSDYSAEHLRDLVARAIGR
jgi:threonine synthase